MFSDPESTPRHTGTVLYNKKKNEISVLDSGIPVPIIMEADKTPNYICVFKLKVKYCKCSSSGQAGSHGNVV